jgi:hypothetical protein
MPFSPLPRRAAWAHQQSRVGFEVVYFRPESKGFRAVGCTTALQDDEPWIVDYEIEIDQEWRTRRAVVSGRSDVDHRAVLLEHDGSGSWWIDGARAQHLDGCFDVDLESSAMTNTLPVHRLGLTIGERADAPAAYVRAGDLGVQRLEQEYIRAEDDHSGQQQYDYSAPAFEFTARLEYGQDGLVASYPGIAVRVW